MSHADAKTSLGWTRHSLNEVTRIVSGATPRTDTPDYWDGDIKWVTPKDLGDLDDIYFSTPARQITASGLASCSAEVLPTGSVLFSSRAPIGLTAITRCPMATNQGFKSFIPIPSKLHAGYLHHWLRANRKYLESLGNGATFKEISKSVLSRVEIEIPAPDEQKRIADILDHADGLRRKRQRALRLSGNFLRSVFFSLFDDPSTNPKEWKTYRFGEIVGDSFRNGLSPATSGTVKGKVVTLSAVTSGQFSSASIKAVMFDKHPSSIQLIKKNTFLISRGNGNKRLVGVGVFPDTDLMKVAFPDTIIGCNLRDEIATPEYIEAIWSTPAIRQQIEAGARTTNGTFKVNQSLLGSINLPIPPLAAQKEYAKIANRHRLIQKKMSDDVAHADALFYSLQHRAFRGEL